MLWEGESGSFRSEKGIQAMNERVLSFYLFIIARLNLNFKKDIGLPLKSTARFLTS